MDFSKQKTFHETLTDLEFFDIVRNDLRNDGFNETADKNSNEDIYKELIEARKVVKRRILLCSEEEDVG